MVTKLCECGCGRETNIILVNNKNQGLVKGEYRRFISGHQSIGRHWKLKNKRKEITSEHRKHLSESKIGHIVTEETRKKLEKKVWSKRRGKSYE